MHTAQYRRAQLNRYNAKVVPIGEVSQKTYNLWDSFLSGRSLLRQLAYQRLEYVRYLATVCRPNTISLISINDKVSHEPVGFVPVETRPVSLSFSYRAPGLGSIRLRGLNIIGSEPLLADEDALPSLFQTFDLDFPDCDAFEFQEVSPNSTLWRYLIKDPEIRRMFGIAVIGGFKQCHVIELPLTVEAYQKAFSRKRRYNTKRQIRLLEIKLGSKLKLVRVSRLGDVERLTEALSQLEPTRRLEHQAQIRRLEAAASAELLLSFILQAGQTTLAVVTGEIVGETYRVHRIVHDRHFANLSPGSTAWQLVLTDLIQRKAVKIVDMGYGTPAYRHRSSNLVEYRGRVIAYRRSLSIILVLKLFVFIWNAKFILKATAKRAGFKVRDLAPILQY